MAAPTICASARVITFALALSLVPVATLASNPQTELVSINRFGTNSGNGDSSSSESLPALSANGRFVVFVSGASDLVATDTNRTSDVFVRDRQTGSTSLVSINVAGTDSGDSDSAGEARPAISNNGRFVAFTSNAHDLVANDSNGHEDVFVRDLQTGTTVLASFNRSGTNGGNGQTTFPRLSADGRYVAFVSAASDLVATDTNGEGDVFVRDLQKGVTTLVSANLAGTDSGEGNSSLYNDNFSMSADGRYVAFVSAASDLTPTPLTSACVHFPSDPDRYSPCRDNVFVRDLQTGTTTLVSANLAGTATGNSPSYFSALSANGHVVAFSTFASDLVATDTNENFDVFVRDLQAGVTSLVTVNFDGTDSSSIRRGQNGFPPVPAALSADGRSVAFEGNMADLVSIDTNEANDVFVRDLLTGTTALASVNRDGTDSARPPSECHPEPGGCVFRPWGSGGPSMSADGRFVAFGSSAIDLVAASDTNGDFDGYARDLQTGSTSLVSINRTGTDTGNIGSGGPNISADGHVVAFTSGASDLVAADNNGKNDVFVRSVGSIVPFARFRPTAKINLVPAPGKDWFEMLAPFRLDTDSNGIAPLTEPVTIQIGTFSTTIPARAFILKNGEFTFAGRIDGVKLFASIRLIKGKNYELWTYANCATLTGTRNPVRAGVVIGDDSGTATITAEFGPKPK